MKLDVYSDIPFLVVTAALLQSIIPIAIGQHKCDALASFRWNSLNFIDDLYVLFLRKIRAFNLLSSYDSISNFEDYINHYIYLFLLGGTLVLNELHLDSGEQRHLNELLFKGSSESLVPKIVGLAEFLTSTYHK